MAAMAERRARAKTARRSPMAAKAPRFLTLLLMHILFSEQVAALVGWRLGLDIGMLRNRLYLTNVLPESRLRRPRVPMCARIGSCKISSSAVYSRRLAPPLMDASSTEVPLDTDEASALAGMWRISMDLDDGMRNLTCFLEGNGNVQTTGDSKFKTARWEASRVEGSRNLTIRFRLGDWRLTGKGVRNSSFQCSDISGGVIEGECDPVHVGRFYMSLILPAASESEVAELEARHLARVQNRPAPPARYQAITFTGMWRLLVTFEGNAPTTFVLTLTKNRKFFSDVEPIIGGSWGVYDTTANEWGKKTNSLVATHGTHLWLRVNRDQSNCTLTGIGGLPVYEGFSLYGRPLIESLEAEIAARSQDGGVSDRVEGTIFFGTSSDREYVVAGRFSLMRVAQPVKEDPSN